MENDTPSLPPRGAMSPLSSTAASLPRSRRTMRRRRPRPTSTSSSPAFALMLSGLALSSSPSPADAALHVAPRGRNPTDDAREGRRGLEAGGTGVTRSVGECDRDQHTFLFTLYTDAYSIHDNHWRLSHAPLGVGPGGSGTYVDSQSVGTGELGYGPVVRHTICADRSSAVAMLYDDSRNTGGENSAVESCYDLILNDYNGDGLTAPWSAEGGMAGGFSLQLDGGTVVEHKGKACLMTDDKDWNDCAVGSGFETCGVRVCATEGGSGGVAKATVSNLGGSQCKFSQPMCDPSHLLSETKSSVTVDLETDSFGEEISWELRRSKKGDSKKMNRASQNTLLLAGGKPVYEKDSTNVILGQLGVGVPLSDNESYTSSACLPDNLDDKSCFDLRVYDAYGDGIGCGDTGTVSIAIEKPGVNANDKPIQERMTLKHKDNDVAKLKRVDGKEQLACMNRDKLFRWSYCAVRVCMDGEVMGLEGNQCSFGMGDDLIDPNYVGEVDPMEGLNMRPYNGGGPHDDEDGWEVVETEDSFEVIVPQNDNDFVVPEDVVAFSDPEDYDTWARYYEWLQPGIQGGQVAVERPDFATTGDEPRPNSAQGNKPRPNSAQAYLNNRPNGGQGQKGPRPDSGKQEDRPKKQDDALQVFSKPVADQGSTVKAELKPFAADLMAVNFPRQVQYTNPSRLSDAVSDYLVEYMEDDDRGNPVPLSFDLECTTGRRRAGSETFNVVTCTGTAVFPSSAGTPPRKKILNDVIKDAVSGEDKEDFLELMYGVDRGSRAEKKARKRARKEAKRKREQMRLQKLQQQQEKMQQQSASVKVNQVSFGDKDRKKRNKMEKKQQRQENKGQQQAQSQSSSALPQDDLNVMGYVSGTQLMNMNTAGNGYAIKDGNIHVYVDEPGGGRRGRRMLRSRADDGR